MPELTAERVRELFNYDPFTGVLAWKKQPRGRYKPSLVAGYRSKEGYLITSVDNKLRKNHRLAWAVAYGAWPKHEIDHINGDKSDNRIANLRDVAHKENVENLLTANSYSKGRVLGVSWHVRIQKFHARIGVNGKLIHLGYYTTPEEAHQAYLTAKRRLHAGNTL